MTNDEIEKGWRVSRQVLQDENDRLRAENARLMRERDESLHDHAAAMRASLQMKDRAEAAERHVATLREALSAVIAEAGVTLRHPAENCRIIGYGVIESARAALAKAKG